MAGQLDLPVSRVFPRNDARKLIPETVRGIMESIREVGIINPIRVRPAKRHVEGILADAYEVTAGHHRLSAALKAGLETVPCIVVEDDDLHAELAMIDENLCRAELDPALRAKQTKRRKEIYEELHPETKPGQHSNRGNQHVEGGQVVHLPSFAESTSQATGKDARTVRRDAERGDKIAPDVLDKVSGTDLNTGAYLDKIKTLDPEKQRARVDADLSRQKADKAASRKASKIDADVKQRAARAVAEIIVAHVPADAWDAVKANLFAAGKASSIAIELTNLAGECVMDRRFA